MSNVLTYTVTDHDNRALWFPILDVKWAGICQGHFEYGRGVACKVIRSKVSRDTAPGFAFRYIRPPDQEIGKEDKKVLDGAEGAE